MLKLLRKSITNHFSYLLVLVATIGSYFAIFFSRVISFKPDGIYAGHVNVWSDWALHISIANIFAFASPRFWFANHPLYAGGKFTYPFLSDFISGMLMRFGVSLKQSFFLPSLATTIVLLAGLYFLFYLLTESKKAAVLSVFIYFLSAGLGFVGYLKDLVHDPSFSSLLYPLKEIGRYDVYQWYASNMVVGLMAPQRAFLIGTALGVWAIVGTLFVILREHVLSKRLKMVILLSAGALAGILPIAHAHSFIAVVAITGMLCLFNIKKWRMLWPYVLTAGIISSVLYLIFIHGGIENASFAQWHPGYTADGDFFDWFRMWTLIWGAMLFLAPVSLYYFRKKIDRSRWAIYGAACTLFVIGNLFLFQPVAWDNSKIFWWVYLIFSAPTALILGDLWARKNVIAKAIATIVLITLTFTGLIELVRLIQIDKHDYMITSADDIQLGLEIREKTDPRAVFLTAPSHNHFVMVWGIRPILMGFTAWAWNYGFDYAPREADMKTMFLGGDTTDELMRKYRISYIVIGPGEIHDLHANEHYFRERFPLVFHNSNYRIYDTRSVLRY